MTKIEVQLINLINENKSINEICEILNFSRNQVYKRLLNLKNNGYTIKNMYYYNGDIKYKLIHGHLYFEENTTSIEMKKNENIFRAIVISDLHIGCDKQRLDLLDQVYNYCIKNNINIILNAGDLVDGWFGQNKKINKDIEHQLHYLLKKYPFDKNILNFICLGNHDSNSYQKFGINLKTLLTNYRHDLISFASGIGHINVKNDDIVICHPLNHNKSKFNEINDSIIFKGHHHRFASNFNEYFYNHIICVPSLSNIFLNNEFPLPSALTIEFNIGNHGKFNEGVVSQLISLNNELIKINEIKISNFHKKENMSNNVKKKNKNINNKNNNDLDTTITKKDTLISSEENSEQPKIYSKIKLNSN